MTKTLLQNYRNMLEEKQVELEKAIRNREAIIVESSPDAIDRVQQKAESEIAIRNLDHDSCLLRSVRAALWRIDERSYGACLKCEEDINPKRLNAVPWTPFCVQCQAALDPRVEDPKLKLKSGPEDRKMGPIPYGLGKPNYGPA